MVTPVGFGTNEFVISPEAAQRLENFLASAERAAPTHNINNYWQKRREWLSFQRTENGIVIRNDSNLGDSIPGDYVLKQPFPGQLGFTRLLLRGALAFQPRTKNTIQELKLRHHRLAMGRLYHAILSESNPYFPFGYWKSRTSFLSTDPLRRVIARWPYRAIHMLRAIDVILHHKPVPTGRPLRVLEIGSGPAILAGMMQHVLRSQHTLIDLPEQAVVGFTFLSECFPKTTVRMPHESTSATQPKPDITILTPEQTAALEPQSFDVAINMFSFQEMSYEAVNEYLRLIRMALVPDGIVYCLNRVMKGNKHDATTMEFAKYGWSDQDQFLHDQTMPPQWRGVPMAGSPYREAVVRMGQKSGDKV